MPSTESPSWLTDKAGFFAMTPLATTCAPMPLLFNTFEAMAKSECCSQTNFTMRANCKYQAEQEERLGVVYGGDSSGTSMAQVPLNDQVIVPSSGRADTP